MNKGKLIIILNMAIKALANIRLNELPTKTSLESHVLKTPNSCVAPVMAIAKPAAKTKLLGKRHLVSCVFK
jgi:hypothetical protein